MMLFPVEGPALTSEDLQSLLTTLRGLGYTGSSGCSGIGEFRFRSGRYDFDVFVFSSGEINRVEFRTPYSR